MAVRALAVLLLAACSETFVAELDQCELSVGLDVTEALPGDELFAEGGPQSELYDTVVRAGSVSAEVLEVVREECSDCDTCRAVADCTACEVCVACEPECTPCLEGVRFRVPELEPGPATFVIANQYGASNPLPVSIDTPEAP